MLIINHALPHQAKLANESSQLELQHANMETVEKRVVRVSELAICDSSLAVTLFGLVGTQFASVSGDFISRLCCQPNSHTYCSALLWIAHWRWTPAHTHCPVALRGVLWVWRGFTHEQYCVQPQPILSQPQHMSVIEKALKTSRECILSLGKG